MTPTIVSLGRGARIQKIDCGTTVSTVSLNTKNKNCQYDEANIARIANDVPCSSLLKGDSEC